ncbi:MAG: LacI family DNA-binding transcriptional regulator [Bacteroidetes bacterium]|nr:LacI family DNA-binding transcriptional regulator [Bacteroidota bacterium]
MATRKDVAAQAGVSTTTVTNVLHNRSNVSDKVKTRVKNIAKSLNYQPNAVARALTLNRTEQIGVIVNFLTNPFFAEMFNSITDRLHHEGYKTIALNGDFLDLDYISAVLHGRVDGLVIFDGTLPIHVVDAMIEHNIPFVTHGYESSTHFQSVEPDYLGGIEQIVDHLVRLGHTHIAFLAWRTINNSYRRFTGYCNSLQKHGLKIISELIVEEYSPNMTLIDAGYQSINTLLDRKTDCTAVICYSDLMAIGACSALQKRGVRIPEDISIVGWDNIFYTKYMTPPLTTVHSSPDLMAKAMVSNLTKQLKGEQVDMIQKVPVELIERESTSRIN